jgi:hypothetical protein
MIHVADASPVNRDRDMHDVFEARSQVADLSATSSIASRKFRASCGTLASAWGGSKRAA